MSILRIKKNSMIPESKCIEKHIKKAPFGFLFTKVYKSLDIFLRTNKYIFGYWIMSQRCIKFYEMMFRLGSEMINVAGDISLSTIMSGRNKEILQSLFENTNFVKYTQIYNALSTTNISDKFTWLTSWLGTIVNGVSFTHQEDIWKSLFKSDSGLPTEGQLETIMNGPGHGVISTCTSALNCLTTGVIGSVQSFISPEIHSVGESVLSGAYGMGAKISSVASWFAQKVVQNQDVVHNSEVKNIDGHISDSFEIVLYIIVLFAIAASASSVLKYVINKISNSNIFTELKKRVRLGFMSPKLKIRGKCNHRTFFKFKPHMHQHIKKLFKQFKI